MKTPFYITVYFAVTNPIIQNGLEHIIKSNFDENINSLVLNEFDDIDSLSIPNEQGANYFLICESTNQPLNFKLRLFNLIQKFPNLKVIYLTDDFDKKRLKVLYNIGVTGVINSSILPSELVDVLTDNLNGKKAMSSFFQKKLINQFCKKDQEFDRTHISGEIDIDELDLDNSDDYFGLTKREKEILCLICNGENTKEISDKLYISHHTAETHRRKLLMKLDVKNTAEMVKVAVMGRLIPVQSINPF